MWGIREPHKLLEGEGIEMWWSPLEATSAGYLRFQRVQTQREDYGEQMFQHRWDAEMDILLFLNILPMY